MSSDTSNLALKLGSSMLRAEENGGAVPWPHTLLLRARNLHKLIFLALKILTTTRCEEPDWLWEDTEEKGIVLTGRIADSPPPELSTELCVQNPERASYRALAPGVKLEATQDEQGHWHFKTALAINHEAMVALDKRRTE
ncbi:hypothetical protein EG328_000028 [Venturia inaequalis]|uniref:Uncharacterized protein n=1 Tax=Venturia inaequalis TaxID=5025 RepID=A0A8H3ZDA9_VENIN|nr:hypothetical protein EG327_004050 [Venturia inaequalis]KAE9989097.1 hypothetical protein EG328_000028 [Venturia inaequalis]